MFVKGTPNFKLPAVKDHAVSKKYRELIVKTRDKKNPVSRTPTRIALTSLTK